MIQTENQSKIVIKMQLVETPKWQNIAKDIKQLNLDYKPIETQVKMIKNRALYKRRRIKSYASLFRLKLARIFLKARLYRLKLARILLKARRASQLKWRNHRNSDTKPISDIQYILNLWEQYKKFKQPQEIRHRRRLNMKAVEVLRKLLNQKDLNIFRALRHLKNIGAFGFLRYLYYKKSYRMLGPLWRKFIEKWGRSKFRFKKFPGFKPSHVNEVNPFGSQKGEVIFMPSDVSSPSFKLEQNIKIKPYKGLENGRSKKKLNDVTAIKLQVIDYILSDTESESSSTSTESSHSELAKPCPSEIEGGYLRTVKLREDLSGYYRKLNFRSLEEPISFKHPTASRPFLKSMNPYKPSLAFPRSNSSYYRDSSHNVKSKLGRTISLVDLKIWAQRHLYFDLDADQYLGFDFPELKEEFVRKEKKKPKMKRKKRNQQKVIQEEKTKSKKCCDCPFCDFSRIAKEEIDSEFIKEMRNRGETVWENCLKVAEQSTEKKEQIASEEEELDEELEYSSLQFIKEMRNRDEIVLRNCLKGEEDKESEYSSSEFIKQMSNRGENVKWNCLKCEDEEEEEMEEDLEDSTCLCPWALSNAANAYPMVKDYHIEMYDNYHEPNVKPIFSKCYQTLIEVDHLMGKQTISIENCIN